MDTDIPRNIQTPIIYGNAHARVHPQTEKVGVESNRISVLRINVRSSRTVRL